MWIRQGAKMRKVLFVCLAGILLAILPTLAMADNYVNGYYRSNGTYVDSYWRSDADSSPYNNYSYPGNTNPYTGKTATGSSSSYFNNYYDSSNDSDDSLNDAGNRSYLFNRLNKTNNYSSSSTNTLGNYSSSRNLFDDDDDYDSNSFLLKSTNTSLNTYTPSSPTRISSSKSYSWYSGISDRWSTSNILDLQSTLKSQGLYSGSLDGVYGSKTMFAHESYLGLE